MVKDTHSKRIVISRLQQCNHQYSQAKTTMTTENSLSDSNHSNTGPKNDYVRNFFERFEGATHCLYLKVNFTEKKPLKRKLKDKLGQIVNAYKQKEKIFSQNQKNNARRIGQISRQMPEDYYNLEGKDERLEANLQGNKRIRLANKRVLRQKSASQKQDLKSNKYGHNKTDYDVQHSNLEGGQSAKRNSSYLLKTLNSYGQNPQQELISKMQIPTKVKIQLIRRELSRVYLQSRQNKSSRVERQQKCRIARNQVAKKTQNHGENASRASFMPFDKKQSGKRQVKSVNNLHYFFKTAY